MKEKLKQKNGVKTAKGVLLALIVLVVAALIVILIVSVGSKESTPEVISKSTLEKIIKVSDLSTFEAVYNGIAKVSSEDNPEEVDYYVSYDAKVKAGVDFNKVDIDIDKDKKMIYVKIPEIKITDVNVDIASLDYIFINDSANTSTVSAEAYEKCIEDVTNESNGENAVFELAEQNAHNIIEALINPFVEQFDEEYKLQIN